MPSLGLRVEIRINYLHEGSDKNLTLWQDEVHDRGRP
jgi:hypothetical protein